MLINYEKMLTITTELSVREFVLSLHFEEAVYPLHYRKAYNDSQINQVKLWKTVYLQL